MTMTLNLSDDQERVLREAAAQQQTSPEDVVMLLVTQFVGAQDDGGESRRARIKAAGDYVQKKNAELYERLA